MFFKPTPHRRVATYLIFKASTPQAAIDNLRRMELEYVLPSLSDAEAAMKMMRNSMPEALRAWHEFAPVDQPAPPVGDEALKWLDRVGILVFCEQLMDREPGRRNEDFHDAWNLFSMKSVRRMAEGLKLADMTHGAIQVNLRLLGAEFSMAALDVFFNEFFAASDFGDADLSTWIGELGVYAQTSLIYVNDYESKRHGLMNKFDVAGVLEKLGVVLQIEPAVMTRYTRSRMFTKFNNFANDRDMERMSKDAYWRRMSSAKVMKELAAGIDKSLETERTCKLLESTENTQAATLELVRNNLNVMSREILAAEGKLAKRKLQLPGEEAPESEPALDPKKH